MKKFTFSLFFVILTGINYNALCQDKQIDGFFGIKFGTDRQSVIDTMLRKGSALDSLISYKKSLWSDNITTLHFENVTYGDRKAQVFFVELFKNKVFEVSFSFSPEEESGIIDIYNEMVNDISVVYGKGESFKKFNAPFKDGDFREITAIKTGNAVYATYWKIGTNRIDISILPNPVSISLTCSDGALSHQAYGNQK